MIKNRIICQLLFLLIFVSGNSVFAQKTFNDTLTTSKGDLIIHVLGHASILFEYNNLKVYVDPNSNYCDYSKMDKADLILITHGDADHFDKTAINLIKNDETQMIYTKTCASSWRFDGIDTTMANGDSLNILDLPIKAVPAYNIVKTRHVKGIGNGYLILFGNKNVYISGDTEILPEMANLKDIELAFLGYSQPYNMTTEMLIQAAELIHPKILIPYHYDNTDISLLLDLLKNIPDIEVLTGIPSISSSIKNLNYKVSGKIYPNPVHDILYCEELKPNLSLTITNMAGQQILSGLVTVKGSFNVSSIPVGLYGIHFTGNNGEVNALFFKK